MPLPADLPTVLLPYYDVLVIGAGAAGLYASLCLPQHLTIGLVTKEPLSLSASDWAQGGIAAVVDPQDSPMLHGQDTLKAGVGLCDDAAVKFLVAQAPACIQKLVEMGVGFDRHQGELALTLEAAHSRRRVLHAADTTGRAVVSTLATHVLKRQNIQVIQAFTLDIWMDESHHRCRGIHMLMGDRLLWLQAGTVILATGGGGQVFAQTTNPALSTGDGVAMAHRAGAVLRDLEFVQFHPTALTKAGAPRFLISEAVRGEGAHLVDNAGHRFTFDYHPAGELAPRDVVSRAIYSHLQKTAADPATAAVWLDLRPIAADRISYRFPNIVQVCQQWGIDVFRTPIPVAPAAHYWMGGIVTSLTNETSVPGLSAVGEVASTGVHGANRLASNSLLECLVFGAQFAHLAVPRATPQPLRSSCFFNLPLDEVSQVQIIRQELPRIVWQGAGICREQGGLEAAIAQVEARQQEFDALTLTQTMQNLTPGQALTLPALHAANLRQWGETRNLLEIAQLILRSAAFRTESRGGHYRSDFPTAKPSWQVHTMLQKAGQSKNRAQRSSDAATETYWWTSPVNSAAETPTD